jgi:hypothetical protein
MNRLQFPLSLRFKISTFSSDFVAKDAQDRTIAYVRQKMFKLKEDVSVFSDESKERLQFSIKANKWLDFSASYQFLDSEGMNCGRVVRKGWKSIWKARYEIYDELDNQDLLIQEENAWVKVADSFLGELPILGFFTGYLFNPKYIVTRPDGTEVARLIKNPSFFGRKFNIEQLGDCDVNEEARLLLALMMMVLLERRRG